MLMRFDPPVLRLLMAWLAIAASTVTRASAETRTVTVVAGPQYRAGAFHEFLLGRDYRPLWTAPVELPVLDLASFAGGLDPVRRVGGQETKGLALRGKDGRSYTFRSVDKDPSAILPADLQGTVAERIVQDQIASAHPAAPLIADRILEAAGVLHAEHLLVVMPDDPRLGEFQKEFAGIVGTVEEYPAKVTPGAPAFQGATEILDHKEAYRRFERDPEDRPDARALLTARLVDLLIGDWDRHREQWRWAKMPGREGWQPIPEDRDQAFCRFEGLILAIARDRQPRFVKFSDEYPDIDGLTWNGWDQDRRLLVELDRTAFEQAAAALKERITDAVIEEAARRMPPEYQRIDGARLVAALRARRDALPEAAERFYRHLARSVDVHATDAAEVAEVVRNEDGDLDLRISRPEPGATPHFERRFRRDDTDEVRLYLHGGANRVVVKGPRDGIVLRVIGGKGTDTVDDSAGGGTRVHDVYDEDRIVRGPGTDVDGRVYVPPPPNPRAPWIPPRDWGRRTVWAPWFSGGPDVGVFLGAGIQTDAFGFRKDPYASRQFFRAGYATVAKTFRAEYEGEYRRASSGVFTSVVARASGIEVLNFYGFGNETPRLGPDAFHRLKQEQYTLAPALHLPLAPRVTFSLGPVVKFAHTADNEGRFIAVARPYGTGDFGELGAAAGLRLDTRDRSVAASRGVVVDVAGSYYPEVWDVASGFGEVHGEAVAHLTAGGAMEPGLAFRAGAKRVWGEYPFHEAAFIGGGSTVRGFRSQRFAGDASVHGGAELRLKLARVSLVIPADVGLFALGDVGRVYLEGETSDKWHTAVGGGLWIAFLDRANTISVAVARSDERTAVYVRAGFGF